MYPLAHLGIGSLIARPVSAKLPFRWLLLGTLLPDLIDKPIFFALALIEHFRTGGWVPGKRGFAHTLLFLLLLVAIAVIRRSARWSACAIGTATHLLLDTVSKLFGAHHSASDNLIVLLWPFLGWDFPTMPYGLHGTWGLLLELVGAILLILQLGIPRFRPRTI
jgi:LexA-binding, inner membrane-associated putative hydrolase